MIPCRAINHIESFFAYFKFNENDGHFECVLCTNYSATLSTSTRSEYIFKYGSFNGVDYTVLPRVFRSLKETLQEHVTDCGFHHKAKTWAENIERELKSQLRAAITAGYTLGRLTYAIIYRGRPHSDFTMDMLLASKNGAVTGDINHSPKFVLHFLTACAAVLQRELTYYLSTPLDCTGRRPPIALSCDKITQKRRREDNCNRYIASKLEVTIG